MNLIEKGISKRFTASEGASLVCIQGKRIPGSGLCKGPEVVHISLLSRWKGIIEDEVRNE